MCRWVWICIGALIVANIVFHIVLLAAAQFLGPYGGTANIQSEESLAQREYAKHGGEGYNPVSLQVDEVQPVHCDIQLQPQLHAVLHCLLEQVGFMLWLRSWPSASCKFLRSTSAAHTLHVTQPHTRPVTAV